MNDDRTNEQGPIDLLRAAITCLYGLLSVLFGHLIEHGGGHDPELLATSKDHRGKKRQHTIGLAVVISTLVGGVGWFFKLTLNDTSIRAILVAATISLLYMLLSFNVEAFFTSEVNALAAWWRRLLSFCGRFMMASVVAGFATMPWLMVGLRDVIPLEQQRLALERRQDFQSMALNAYAVPGLHAATEQLEVRLQRAEVELGSLPASIDAMLATATKCEADAKQVTTVSRAAIAVERRQLARLLETANRDDAGAAERARIERRIARLQRAIELKNAECPPIRIRADEARSAYLDEKAAAKATAAAALDNHVREVAVAESRAKKQIAASSELIDRSTAIASGTQMEALLAAMLRSPSAMFMAFSIFLGLLIVDLLPLSLRLLAQPIDYDRAKHLMSINAHKELEVRHQVEWQALEAAWQEANSPETVSATRQAVQAEVRAAATAAALRGLGSRWAHAPAS